MSTDLLPGERPLALVRQHWSVIAAPLAGAAVVVLTGVVALALMPASIAGVPLGGAKLAITGALVVAVLGWTLLHYLRWRLATFLLTDRRIIVEGGVLSRFSESITLDRIQNTVLRRPVSDRLIGAGEIEIESAGRDGVEVMHRIPRAAQFYSTLLQAMQEMRVGGSRAEGGPGMWGRP